MKKGNRVAGCIYKFRYLQCGEGIRIGWRGQNRVAPCQIWTPEEFGDFYA